jgi:hypothetical protein
MRNLFAIVALTPLLVAAGPCGDDGDGGGGADAGDECQAYCEAYYADDLEGCEVCGIEAMIADGACACEFLSCVPELCTAWCQESDAGVSGTCSITCVCD